MQLSWRQVWILPQYTSYPIYTEQGLALASFPGLGLAYEERVQLVVGDAKESKNLEACTVD